MLQEASHPVNRQQKCTERKRGSDQKSERVLCVAAACAAVHLGPAHQGRHAARYEGR